MSSAALILLIFLGLATYRLTRFVVHDDFPLVATPRQWVVGEDGTKHIGRWWYWFGELVSCPWCASGWVALGLTALGNVPESLGAYGDYGWGVDFLLMWWATWAIGAVLTVLADRLS